jgi:penicillin-insensitive murein endopeptidase
MLQYFMISSFKQRLSLPAPILAGLATLFLAMGSHAASVREWAAITRPISIGDSPQSIGTYTSGCVSGAAVLPENGSGFQLMRLSRKRFYGHPHLIDFIETLGRHVQQEELGVLLIGDLGQPRGGPTLSGHRSHQTGLDVDIWFMLSATAINRPLSYKEREYLGARPVVDLRTDSMDFNYWNWKNEKILELAARMPEVDRIFVNASIKRQLCLSKAPHDWLRKIRPWWKHEDHFHVRLKCPDTSPFCRRQEPLPGGDGCDASLTWWFSDEAKKPAPKKTEPVKPPPMPLLCEKVLRE